MKVQSVFILFVSCLSTIYGQVPWIGDCSNVQAVAFLDPARFQGVWYQTEAYYSLPYTTATCTSVKFSPSASSNSVFDTEFRFTESQSNAAGVQLGTTSYMYIDKFSGDLQTTLQLANLEIPTPTVLKSYKYRVIDTDYDNYAILWSCFSLKVVHFKSLWVIARNSTYPIAVQEKVHARLSELSIESKILIRSDQNCIAENIG